MPKPAHAAATPEPVDYVQRILSSRVYDLVKQSPLERAERLSRLCDNDVWIKREDLHPVFSFKLRGAYNKMASLEAQERARGVIAASAGNHAQGVAYAAQHLGIRATIVMPVTTPDIKVEAVRQRGAEVVLHGDTYDDAYEAMQARLGPGGPLFIHPYDDPLVIAGQGTVGLELVHQVRGAPDAVFVPVGGGGLIAGVGALLKYVFPEVRIIGVEPAGAGSLYAALAADERVRLDRVGIFADGVAVRQVGVEPFRVAREVVDEVILVETDEICVAIKDLFTDTRSIAEPAGALGVAGLRRYVARTGASGQSLVAIETGANINFNRLRYVAERTVFGEHQEALLCVTIPERRGSFLAFCRRLEGLPITEFNYRYHDVDRANVFVGIALRDGVAQVAALIGRLEREGHAVTDVSGDELAGSHVRFMVGGHAAPTVHDERLFRFVFPDRPTALVEFLAAIGSRWNISLFHYRNHGAAWGHVLVGVQVPSSDSAEFRAFRDNLRYAYTEETHHPAYRLFLR